MQDIELYRHLLGIASPWTISRVALDVAQQRVDVWAEHEVDRRWPCPECGKQLGLYDHSQERVWRHLDSCQFLTYLHASPPRVQCPDHGVKQVQLPWAQERSRFTMMFERFALEVLRQSDVTGARRILRLSWDEAWGLLQRAVERGLRRKQRRVVRRIGIDEKAAAKHHRYVSVVCDLERGTVEYVGDDRKETSLDGYFQSLSAQQREGIEAIAMDMWHPFVAAVRRHLPGGEARIVYDRFHVMKHMGDAVSDVRKREHRELRRAGDETLAGSRFLWLYAEENLPERDRARFAELKSANLKTGRAWAIKESLRRLWQCRSAASARHHWKRWHFWATHSRLDPVRKVAAMIRERIDNVLRYYAHPITNAASEGLNSKIQTIKKMACGFRNREHFKTAIYFHCGGLDLDPMTHAEA
jgi:transposase